MHTMQMTMQMTTRQQPQTDVWRCTALNAVMRTAQGRYKFTMDDVWELLKTDGLNEPDHRTMGAVMREATKLGYCAATNTTAKTKRRSSHRRPLTVWQSLLLGAEPTI